MKRYSGVVISSKGLGKSLKKDGEKQKAEV